MLSTLLGTAARRRTKHRDKAHRNLTYNRRITFEPLEERRLLSTTLTFSKPGMAVYDWISDDAGSSSAGSQWGEHGGIRIGDNDLVGVSEPVYRFDIPRFTTIESIQVSVHCKEYNSDGGGTDLYIGPGGYGFIILAALTPGDSGATLNFQRTTPSEINAWLQSSPDP
ncbi:MAG: hypothetical protein RBS80_31865, partial [Thermoguttaceae bacterium]|nr:hypothetical protein [Thermoguttaceae bacterium]